MRQLQLFTTAQLATMRDRTASRNYSPAKDEFRRTHERHRAWGLQRRYAEKQARLQTAAPHGRRPADGLPSRPAARPTACDSPRSDHQVPEPAVTPHPSDRTTSASPEPEATTDQAHSEAWPDPAQPSACFAQSGQDHHLEPAISPDKDAVAVPSGVVASGSEAVPGGRAGDGRSRIGWAEWLLARRGGAGRRGRLPVASGGTVVPRVAVVTARGLSWRAYCRSTHSAPVAEPPRVMAPADAVAPRRAQAPVAERRATGPGVGVGPCASAQAAGVVPALSGPSRKFVGVDG
jgi:hypothetical protein